MTPEQLNAIKERASKATAGPWVTDVYVSITDICADNNPILTTSDEVMWENPNHVNDASFIAHARQDIPALITEVERLRNEISFIANVDMVTNAYNVEHVAVSVKSWALNALEGVDIDA